MAARISRKQMKEDTFISTMLRAWEYAREHERTILVALAVVVAAIALASWINYSKRESNEKAAASFSEAVMTFRSGDFASAEESFSIIAKEYSGTQAGIYSMYFQGKCALERGRYQEAIEAFDRYLSNCGKYPFFRESALEGKAAAYSNEQKYEEAANIYIELAGSKKTGKFMQNNYLKRAAENFRLANKNQRAIEILETLLDKSEGLERRDIEVEIEILKG